MSTVELQTRYDDNEEMTTTMRSYRFLVATLVVAGGVISVGIAWAAGVIGPVDTPAVLQNEIGSARVSQVVKLAGTDGGSAYVARGIKNGQPVAAIVVGNATTQWFPTSRLFQHSDIAATAGAGGDQQARWFAVAGFASPRVARLQVVRENGAAFDVSLASDGAFAENLDPEAGRGVISLVAYDAAGREIARRDFSEPAAPDS